MAYNIYNNFTTFYYNVLANFYLCFNIIAPFYDDVIITLQKKALMSLYRDTSSSEIKKKRFIQFISEAYEMLDTYSVLFNNEKGIEFQLYDKTDESSNDSLDEVSESCSDTEEDNIKED